MLLELTVRRVKMQRLIIGGKGRLGSIESIEDDTLSVPYPRVLWRQSQCLVIVC